jgi:alpha-tubulin suppressor-like RCC1 family protein
LFAKLQSLNMERLTFSRSTCKPAPVALLDGSPDFNVVQVSAGGESLAAVTVKGKVFTWGHGFYGELGHGERYEETFNATPKVVSELKDKFVVQVSCGFQHTLFLTEEGDVYACGKIDSGALGIKNMPQFNKNKLRVYKPMLANPFLPKGEVGLGRVVKIACGFRHSVALDEEGRVWCTGKNAHGQLGQVNKFTDTDEFVEVIALAGLKVIDIAAGQFHTIALTDAGLVFTFGASRNGQCGRPRGDAVENPEAAIANPELKVTVSSMPPGVVSMPDMGAKFTKVFAGFVDSAVLTDCGKCVFFGSGNTNEAMNMPYAAMQDVAVYHAAFGLNTSFAIGRPQAPYTTVT